MFSFKKKNKNSISGDQAPNAEGGENLKSITESLYKQNLELAIKNKTLSLLGKLYEISILTLEPDELAQKASTAIQENFSFELVGIFLFDKSRDSLSPLAFAESERLRKVEENFGIFFDKLEIQAISKSPLFTKIIGQNEMGYTEKIDDIWNGSILEEMQRKIGSEGHVRSSIVYPLVIEHKTIGAFVLSLNRMYDSLPQYEKESIKSFVNVIVIALEKALIYRELKITNEKLAAANRQLESLVHFVSHEVKGVLGKNRIIFNELIENTFGPTSLEMTKMITQVDSDTKKTVEMVMDILRSTDLKNGKLLMMRAPFDFKESVLHSIESAKTEAEKKGLSIKTQIDEKSNYIMTGDGEKINQHVIRNLLDNATRYTPKGSFTVSLSRKDDKILFSVKDSGVGITKEDMQNLFTEGGRGKNSTLVNVNSTGYGLFFAKGIVEAHKGRIWAESEGEGKGSVFFVELPIK